MVSINSCVAVDFCGQVSSESIGKLQISGVGGQVDFTRGANMSRNGRAIIAMASTTKNDAESKIVPFFGEGTPVTTSRFDSRYIVTEYGIAYMRGKTLRDRARALIAISHPKFKPGLIETWEQIFNDKYVE
jgi:4-hydroxybutyrate CoA-transferase